MFGLPEWAEDELYSHIDVHFAFWDRVKILLGWNVTLTVTVTVEHAPGRCQSKSSVSVWWPRKIVGGMAEVEQPKPLSPTEEDRLT